MDASAPVPADTPPSSLLRRGWSAGMAFWHLGNRLLLGVLPVVLGGFAVLVVLREAARQPIEVAAISVPAALSDTGMTGDVVALRLLDAIEATARAVHAETMQRPLAELEGSQPDINIPVAGISLRSLAAVVRNLLGWPDRRVTGEVVTQGDQLRLRLRLAGHGVVAEVDAPASEGAHALLARGAPEVWRVVSPRLYAWHVAGSDIDQRDIRDRLALLLRRAADGDTEATITYLIARSLVRSGQAREALARLDDLVARRPDYPAGQYGRAMALRALGRGEEALAAQGRGLALDPASGWAHLASAELLREAGRLPEALAAARRAQDLDDDDRPGLVEESTVLRLMGQIAAAADAARRALALDPRHAPALAALGHVLLAQGEAVPALAAFDRALAITPRLADAHTGRGSVLAALGRTPEALEALGRAIALDEVDHRPHEMRGEVLRGLQQWAEAVEAFEQALTLAPDRPALHLGRAVSLLQLARGQDALEALRKAQSLGMNDQTVASLIAEAEAQMAQGVAQGVAPGVPAGVPPGQAAPSLPRP